MYFSFRKIFFALASVIMMFAVLILAKVLLIPLGFALLLAFILLPLGQKFESWGTSRIPAALLAISLVLIVLVAGIGFFSNQIIQLSQEFTHFQDRVIKTIGELSILFNEHLSFLGALDENELYERIKSWLDESTGFLMRQTFTSTATFVTGLVATVIYTFLLLIYRTGLVRAMTHFYPPEFRSRAVAMFRKLQQVGKKYLVGMLILVLVIGLVNSVGLWIIGVDNPFLFGYLGALLSIIPYVGTFIGALLPILYAFIAMDSLGMAVAVAVLFWFVQLLSDNLLSPKIVGGSLRINALAAILSLIIGALVWGIAGMILFLPFTAMLLVVAEEYPQLRPLALLIRNQVSESDSSGTGQRVQQFLRWVRGFFRKPSKT